VIRNRIKNVQKLIYLQSHTGVLVDLEVGVTEDFNVGSLVGLKDG